MNEDFKNRLRAALEALEPDLGKTIAPVGVDDQAAAPTGYMTMDEQFELRRKLKKLSTQNSAACSVTRPTRKARASRSTSGCGAMVAVRSRAFSTPSPRSARRSTRRLARP